jgi:tRNA-splicing ligase RtcB
MQTLEEKGKVPIKLWTDGVELEQAALNQLRNVASLPIVAPHVAVMPDVHYGVGATVGSVIPTINAIIPAAVGVDIGCGMMALNTGLDANTLPPLKQVRDRIENLIPVGKTAHEYGVARLPKGWEIMSLNYKAEFGDTSIWGNAERQMGTLGGGNHFIEVCEDERANIWVMLHSGSRNIGNRIGNLFISRAKDACERAGLALPDRDLAYLEDGSVDFALYVQALGWAQEYARRNRETMMNLIVREFGFPITGTLVNCHHNYVETMPDGVYITRKGAVSAREGELGIIPGSMGAKSFIVRGKGCAESFWSCSHGAGRRMARGAAKRSITLDEHIRATEGIECRKDAGVLDESPRAYKDIDAVMAAQADLVETVHTLRQLVCVKG